MPIPPVQSSSPTISSPGVEGHDVKRRGDEVHDVSHLVSRAVTELSGRWSDVDACVSCEVSARPELQLFADDVIVVNHFLASPDAPRIGWVVVSPRRHVTRLFALTPGERSRLFEVCAAVDALFTHEWHATRTMVASLGWETDAHLHVHCAPTFHPFVTGGHRTFEAYASPITDLDDACRTIASGLRARLGVSGACDPAQGKAMP